MIFNYCGAIKDLNKENRCVIIQNQAQKQCARALYAFAPHEEGQLLLDEGMIIDDLDGDLTKAGWWLGTAYNGTRGYFPSNYVELISFAEVETLFTEEV